MALEEEQWEEELVLVEEVLVKLSKPFLFSLSPIPITRHPLPMLLFRKRKHSPGSAGNMTDLKSASTTCRYVFRFLLAFLGIIIIVVQSMNFASLQDEKQSQTEAASLIPHSLPPPEVEIDLEAEGDAASSGPSATPPPTPPQRMDSICLT